MLPSTVQSRVYVITIVIILGLGVLFLSYYSSESNQISSYQNQINLLNGQNQDLQSTNNELEVELTNAQNRANTPLNLSQSAVEANDISVSAHCIANITQFEATTAGYLLVVGSTSSPNSSILLTEYYQPRLNGVTLGEFPLVQGSNNLIIPVTTGFVTVYLESEQVPNPLTDGSCNSHDVNFDAFGTFSVQYYYY